MHVGQGARRRVQKFETKQKPYEYTLGPHDQTRPDAYGVLPANVASQPCFWTTELGLLLQTVKTFLLISFGHVLSRSHPPAVDWLGRTPTCQIQDSWRVPSPRLRRWVGSFIHRSRSMSKGGNLSSKVGSEAWHPKAIKALRALMYRLADRLFLPAAVSNIAFALVLAPLPRAWARFCFCKEYSNRRSSRSDSRASLACPSLNLISMPTRGCRPSRVRMVGSGKSEGRPKMWDSSSEVWDLCILRGSSTAGKRAVWVCCHRRRSRWYLRRMVSSCCWARVAGSLLVVLRIFCRISVLIIWSIKWKG